VLGVKVTGCESTDAVAPMPAPASTMFNNEPPRTVVDGLVVPVTYGDYRAASANTSPSSEPPHLLINGTSVEVTHADWPAISSVPATAAASITSPNWAEIAVPMGDERLTLTFNAGPLPVAVSVTGYEAIGADGLPTGQPQRDHGVIPAAGVTEADGHLTLSIRGRPEYLAVQFRWRALVTERADGLVEYASATATYLVHLGRTA